MSSEHVQGGRQAPQVVKVDGRVQPCRKKQVIIERVPPNSVAGPAAVHAVQPLGDPKG